MPVYFTFFWVIDFKEMNNQSISKSNMNTNTDEVERTYEGSTRAGAGPDGEHEKRSFSCCVEL